MALATKWPATGIIVWFGLHNALLAQQQGYADPVAAADIRPLQDHPELVRQFLGLEPWEWRAHYGAFPEDDKLKVLSPEFSHWAQEYSAASYLADWWKKGTAQDPLNQMLEVDIQTLLPNEILFFCDRLAMAHSVETRSPYLDFRFAEIAASIPGEYKIKQGMLKYILKKVAAKYLPREILDRPKEGFVLPKHVWLRRQLNPLLDEWLNPERLAKHGFFDSKAVQRLITEHQNQIRDHSFRIWALVVFQIWMHTFLEETTWLTCKD